MLCIKEISSSKLFVNTYRNSLVFSDLVVSDIVVSNLRSETKGSQFEFSC